MKRYTAKTLEDCLKAASSELNVNEKDLLYVVEEEKKGLFVKKVTIAVTEISDVIEYAENYIKDVCHELGLDASLKTFYRDDIIKILIETNHNSILIGNNGSSLQSLNELTKLAVSSKFKRKFRILLDIGNYKDKKYSKVIFVAKKAAKEVLKTHGEIKLDPMTPDERKKVHNALSTWKGISTESIGDGKNRAIVIKFVGNDKVTTNEPKEKAEEIKVEETTTSTAE